MSESNGLDIRKAASLAREVLDAKFSFFRDKTLAVAAKEPRMWIEPDKSMEANQQAVFDQVLDEAAVAMIAAVLPFIENQQGFRTDNGNDPPRIFFWPGYNSVYVRDREKHFRRRTIRLDDKLQVTHGVTAGVGVGFDFSNRPPGAGDPNYACLAAGLDKIRAHNKKLDLEYLKFNILPSTFVYELLLNPEGNDFLTDQFGSKIYPGGTHAWLASQEVEIPRSLQSSSYRRLWAMNVFQLEEARRSFPIDFGTLEVNLNDIEPIDWGSSLCTQINEWTKAEFAWPYIPEAELLEDGKRQRSISCFLYSIWLLSTFRKDWQEHINSTIFRRRAKMLGAKLDFVDQLLQQYRNLELTDFMFVQTDKRDWRDEFAQSQKELQPFKDFSFTRWYSVPLDPSSRWVGELSFSLDIRDDKNSAALGDQLGSCMFLTNFRLDGIYLGIVATWLRKFYAEIRRVEESLILQQTTRLNYRDVFSHQMQGIFDAIVDSQGFTHLDFETRFSLWNAEQLSSRVFGMKGTEKTQQNIGLIIEDDHFDDLRKKDAFDILQNVIRIATYHGIQKASVKLDDNDFLGLDSVVVSKLKKFVEIAKRIKQESNKDIETCYELVNKEMKLLIAPPRMSNPDFILERGFLIATYHAFWQAIRHGIRAVGEYDKDTPLVWLDWETQDSLWVCNRSLPVYSRETTNKHPNKESRDKEFFEYLNKRDDYPVEIAGPFQFKDYWAVSVNSLVPDLKRKNGSQN